MQEDINLITGLRDYAHASEIVKNFYKRHHKLQTFDYVQKKKEEFYPLRKFKVSPNQMCSIIEETYDDSDPDFENGSQVHHNILTAEGCKIVFPDKDYMHLIGFIHDLGKVVMYKDLYGLESWSVVGDMYPVGCKFSDKIVYSEYLLDNPDFSHEVYSTELGIYNKNCGFDNLNFSFSHDEIIYQFLLQNSSGSSAIPYDGLYCARYHSFYPWHQHQAYSELASSTDWELLSQLKLFQSCDLYTKTIQFDKSNMQGYLNYYLSLWEKYIGPLDKLYDL